jgi:ubiquinone biosynthesis protein UbiJ
MFHALNQVFAPAMVERVVLVLNHVLRSEPIATERLRGQTGRCIRLHLQEWPKLLPDLPLLVFRITPAGLLEWCGDAIAPEADLEVRIDASNPARLVARAFGGDMPAIDVQGDAALATDVNWLLESVRWDVEADLARLIDPRLAHEVARFGSILARGLRASFRAGAGLAARVRPEAS